MAVLRLRDGRLLAWAEYGEARGWPVFFFHGTPGSRSFRPPDGITQRLRARLICVERPGYGDSTFQPRRRLLDWPDDVRQLADALNLDAFAVAAHSGGGPHALACAHALPGRVRAAAVIAGAGPPDAPGATEGMTPLNRFGFRFGRYIPWPLGYLLIWWFFRARAADPARFLARDDGRRPPADDEILRDPTVRALCVQSEREAFRQGLRAFAWDVRVITRPWGFPLNEIKAPVHIWHGTADDAAPLSMARFMAAQIPNSELTIFENEGHMLLFPHWEEILSAIHP